MNQDETVHSTPLQAQPGLLAITSGYDADAVLADRKLEPAIVSALEGVNWESFQFAHHIKDILATMSARVLISPPSAVLVQLESTLPGASTFFPDQKHCEDFKLGILAYFIQTSFLKSCQLFMKSCEEAEDVDIYVSGTYCFCDCDATGDGALGTSGFRSARGLWPSTRERRDELLNKLHMLLEPVWRLYGLSDQQVSIIVKDTIVKGCLQDIIGEVGIFMRLVSKCAVTSYEPVTVPSTVPIDRATMKVRLGGPVAAGEVPTVVCMTDIGLRSRYRGPYGEEVVTELKKPQVVSSGIWTLC